MTKEAVNKTLGKMGKHGVAYDSDPATLWLAVNLSKIQTSMSQKNFIEERTRKLEKQHKLNKVPVIRGRMFFFGYSPKTRNELSFWDEFPLIVVLSRTPKYIVGLNFHYIPPAERAVFLNRLFYFVSDENWIKNHNENAFFDLTYKMIKKKASLLSYKKCIKKYYFSNIMTRMLFISPMEWKTIPFFPLDKFKGMGREQIWRMGIDGKTNNR